VKLSVIWPETRSVANAISLAQRSESTGFDSFFLGTAFGLDPIGTLGVVAQHTDHIGLGTSVVPTWPRHPFVMAQQAATTNAASGGRFRLGIGPSHPPVMSMYGIASEHPVSHTREYLTVVKSLLGDGSVKLRGEHFSVFGFLDVEDGGSPPVLLGALRPRLCHLAGELADGAIPWLVPPEYLAETIVPALADGARAAGRTLPPPVLASMPCVLSRDRDAVLEAAGRDLGIYLGVPTYVDVFVRAGLLPDPAAAADGWTPALVDAVLAWGDADALRARLQRWFDAGADELIVSPVGCGDDPAGNVDELLEVLGDFTRS
jgi:F420-dependent oxidoreductase-like protein